MPFRLSPQPVAQLRVSVHPVAPSLCACCMAPAAVPVVERGPGRAELIVQYCEACQRHVSARSTRTLAVVLASWLLSITVGVALLLLWPLAPLGGYLACVALAGLLPLIAGLWVPGLKEPHTARHRAVFWVSAHELVCTNPRWADQLAANNQTEKASSALVEARFSGWFLMAVLPLGVAPAAHGFLWPEVSVLNLTDWQLHLYVDGEQVSTLNASAFESLDAVERLRIPAGQRLLEARTMQGTTVSRMRVQIHPGERHLYAPAASEQCFWLERTAYGRVRASETTLEPLPDTGGFWTLSTPIDTWFAPNPRSTPGDVRSTGGVMVALRHSRCVQAPKEVTSSQAGDTRDWH